MKNTTAILISFLRPGYTKACVESLQREYPDIKIIVGENGNWDRKMDAFCQARGVKYINLPYDSGVCIGRNELMKEVKTEYVLIGDDDFYYDKNAKLEEMQTFIENHPEFDVIGGRVSVDGIVGNYQGHIKRFDDHLETTPIKEGDDCGMNRDEKSGLRYCPADLTFNYFIGRTEKIIKTPWDEKIKVAYEHYSWFLDFKEAGGKVAFSPDPIVIHKPQEIDPEQAPEYAAFRMRRCDKERFYEKLGIKYHICMNGRIELAPGYSLEEYDRDTGNKTKDEAPEIMKKEIKKVSVKYVDFCITTFLRPQAVERLLMSIAKYYPNANVYVADQNLTLDRAFYKRMREELQAAGLVKRLSVTQLEYDCGLSYARNYLVKATPNKYKLILDDDFIFTEKTDIGKFVTLIESKPTVGIVGGLVKQNNVEINFEFNIQIEKGTVTHISDGNKWKDLDGIKYKHTGCVLNFALIKKDVFQHVQWDPNLKVTEHLDFYLKLKKKTAWEVLYTPDSEVDHFHERGMVGYKEKRQRMEFMVKMLKKHKIRRIKYLNGQVYELMEDDSIKRYKEALN